MDMKDDWTDEDTLIFIRRLRNKEFPPELQERIGKDVNWKGLNELETEINRRKLQQKV